MTMRREPVGIYPTLNTRSVLDLAINVRDYGASGSSSSTTGSMTSGSKTLTLTAAEDFQNGQGIAVANAGASPTISAPTAATATAEGTTGSTTIDYAVAALDGAGGVTASFAFSVTDANATLSATNYVALAVTAVTSAAGYAWWRTSTNGTSPTAPGFLGLTTGTALDDTGLSIANAPTGVPTDAPSTALGQLLVTSIVSGAGTTTPTLKDASASSVSGASVVHDDTAAIQDAVNAGENVFIPPGTYRVSSPVTVASAVGITGSDASVKWFNPGLCQIIMSTVSAAFAVTTSYVTISDLAIAGNGAGQNLITATGTSTSQLNGVSLTRLSLTAGGGVSYTYVNRSDITDVSTGFTGSAGFSLDHCAIVSINRCNAGPYTSAQQGTSYSITNGGTISTNDCGSNGANGAPAYRCLYHYNTPNSEHYNFGGNGAIDAQIHIEDTGGVALVNPYVAQTAKVGIRILNSSYTQVIGGFITAATEQTVVIDGGSGSCYAVALAGCYISDGGSGYPMILVSNDVSGAQIIGNTLNGQSNSNYGVDWESTNSASQSAVIGNSIKGTTTAGIKGTGTDPTFLAANNPGFNPVGPVNPPASPTGSGTVYRNPYNVPITVYQPAYASTSGTAGSVAVALGSSTSPSTIYTKQVPGGTTSTAPDILVVRVPSAWSYSFTATGATLQTATLEAE